MSDVLLAMPPVSEAVQFPYLALPQLTAAWRARGHEVRTVDLNLEYRARVMLRDAPGTGGPSGAPPTAGAVFRTVSERYRALHGSRLLRTAGDRTSGFAQEAAIRATGRYVTQQADRDGWILHGPLLLSELDTLVARSRERWSAQWCAGRLDELLTGDPARILGFSVPFFSQVVPVLTLCALVKERRPEQRIMLGGPTVQMWAAALRKRTAAARQVDHWCLGHGEEYPTRLLGGTGPGGRGSRTRIRTGRTAGIRRAEAVEAVEAVAAEAAEAAEGAPDDAGSAGLADGFALNEQPAPDFGPFDFRDYSNQAHQFPYRLTVGCFWGKCTFCSYGNRYRDARAFQQIDPETAARQLVGLSAGLGITDVAVADENTGLRHLLRVMEAVRARGASLTFRIRARLEPELADPAFCLRLREAGCVQVSTGFETSRQEILDSLRKGQDAAHAERAVQNLVRAGIVANLSFMDGYGHPLAARGFHDTVDMIQRHPAELGLDTMQLLVAEPGSYLWAERLRSASDDEYLVTNDGLAFAAGRVGGAMLDGEATEEARRRLLRMTVEAVPDVERASRPDLPQVQVQVPVPVPVQVGRGGEVTALRQGLRARPRFAVALDSVQTRWFLADVAWPRMTAVPAGVVRTPDGFLTADQPGAQRWLTRMIDKRLLEPESPEAESS
ncbi:hypothetical protein GCM10010387_37200 [Streptomyces inusitatus]|uniref:Radical SAM core domain-containing protein n=1 Tax=Streptomyces inusitatus TaxID=68221 RepID=A0A918QAQ9_9ACTN|nr:B12-binding domain-containing radical SAM protein [Streptomyces inusitatus]GGZ39511.1 hypothetical protein GCM10010387_37200 [Streptomyces inusitatus]